MITNNKNNKNIDKSDILNLNNKSIAFMLNNNEIDLNRSIITKMPDYRIESSVLNKILNNNLINCVKQFKKISMLYDSSYYNYDVDDYFKYCEKLISFIVNNFPDNEKDATKFLNVILLSNNEINIINNICSKHIDIIDTFNFAKYAKKNKISYSYSTIKKLAENNNIFSNKYKDFDTFFNIFCANSITNSSSFNLINNEVI